MPTSLVKSVRIAVQASVRDVNEVKKAKKNRILNVSPSTTSREASLGH